MIRSGVALILRGLMGIGCLALVSACASPRQRVSGQQILHVPMPNGSVSSVPYSTGSRSGSAYGPNLEIRDKNGLVVNGETGKILTFILRVQTFSDKCILQKSLNLSGEDFLISSSNCLVESVLPNDCKSSQDNLLEAVRFVRFNRRFQMLDRQAINVLRRCVTQRKLNLTNFEFDEINGNSATFLDIDMSVSGFGTKRQNRLYERYLNGASIHNYDMSRRGYEFVKGMCQKLQDGDDVVVPSFWLLYCGSSTTSKDDGSFLPNSDFSVQIDKLVKERNVSGWSN